MFVSILRISKNATTTNGLRYRCVALANSYATNGVAIGDVIF